MAQSPKLGYPTSGIQAQPLTVAPRFHKPHSTENKIPRLMVKQQSTAKNTQRDTHKEKREEKIKEVKKEESNQANNQAPK